MPIPSARAASHIIAIAPTTEYYMQASSDCEAIKSALGVTAGSEPSLSSGVVNLEGRSKHPVETPKGCTMPDKQKRPSIGMRGLAASAGAGCAISLANYVLPGSGIHGSAGALLVVISTLLMLLAAVALIFARGASSGLRGTLLVLITLDILGTGLAAYMLEATWLVAAMGAALISLVLHFAVGTTQAPRPATPVTTGASS